MIGREIEPILAEAARKRMAERERDHAGKFAQMDEMPRPRDEAAAVVNVSGRQIQP
jgi:hypothetical protein